MMIASGLKKVWTTARKRKWLQKETAGGDFATNQLQKLNDNRLLTRLGVKRAFQRDRISRS